MENVETTADKTDKIEIPGAEKHEAPKEPGGTKGKHTEQEILELLPKENSWEQILYDVVAFENLDPWNVDLNILSEGFASYISALKELDFRIPAKWVIIACVLLRMKSDCIKILAVEDQKADTEFMDMEELAELEDLDSMTETGMEMDPLDALPKRKPVRKITITELVGSLKKVLHVEKKRQKRLEKRRNKIKISSDDITKRIERLYGRITSALNVASKGEVKFSNLVSDWKRDNVVYSFLPLMHLDHEKKVRCWQEKIFDEIFIKKRAAK